MYTCFVNLVASEISVIVIISVGVSMLGTVKHPCQNTDASIRLAIKLYCKIDKK